MRTFLVVNPHSANRQTGKRWPELEAEARKHLGDFTHAFTERPLHARDLARQARDEGYECVVSVGGDGTLNEVVNGLLTDVTSAPVSLGVVPRGTGGDFRRTFEWSDGIPAAFARIREASSRMLDVGVLQFTHRDGSPGTRFFANVCSFGASGRVVEVVNAGGRALGGKIGFLWGTVKALAGYQDRKVELLPTGGPWTESAVTTVAVANGKYFGGGMCVAPEANPSDGIFDVTVWSGYGLTSLAVNAPKLYNGAHVRLSGTRTFKCRTLEARSSSEVLIDCDGEAPGRLPVKIGVVPGALRLLG